MSFIGHDQCPAPKLKEAELSPDQLSSAYLQCVKASLAASCHASQNCVVIVGHGEDVQGL